MHIPVLLSEVLKLLRCEHPGIYVDCTIGTGGHARGILNACRENQVIGIDRDEEALKIASENLREFADRITFVHDNFFNPGAILSNLGIEKVDGFVFDLGVSSIQLESPERGFSFQENGPLDMRMNKREKITASDLVNTLPEKELTEIFWKYGEERWAKRIASAIVKERAKRPVISTRKLAEIVSSAIPYPYKPKKIHPATRTFQALRIAVNKELEHLEDALREAITYLKKGKRICVISFHSLEDRIVKRAFRSLERGCICPPYLPYCVCGFKQTISVLTRKPVRPSAEEIRVNPRARSARLRSAEKLID